MCSKNMAYNLAIKMSVDEEEAAVVFYDPDYNDYDVCLESDFVGDDDSVTAIFEDGYLV
jgi:hypothetical protein